MEGVKFGELLNFGDWKILIWQTCGHVPLSMHIMAQNGRFLFWQMAIKMPNSPNLTPPKISHYTVYCTCTCVHAHVRTMYMYL